MAKLKKILLIEDDEFDAEMTTKSLKEIPLANEIVWLETGVEFLEYLEEHGSKDIAVAILDVRMPKISGIETMEKIREKNYAYFPIVILTSSREAPEIARAYQLGVNAFVTKPVRQNEFQDAIKSLGLFWGILNQLPEE